MQKMQLVMAGFAAGRVALHLIGIAMDHKVLWHAAGIAREFHIYIT